LKHRKWRRPIEPTPTIRIFFLLSDIHISSFQK
jgi:hypothetical protein